jgi:hypothetical protein
MFVVLPRTLPSNPSVALATVAVQATTPLDTTLPAPFIATPPNVSAISAPVDEIFTGYISDISSGDSDDTRREGQDQPSGVDPTEEVIAAKAVANLREEPLGHRIQPAPALRRTKLAIPQAERRRLATAQAATARASDVICSTAGYIIDAGEELEYGKSYEGYWDGTKFMMQVRRPVHFGQVDCE